MRRLDPRQRRLGFAESTTEAVAESANCGGTRRNRRRRGRGRRRRCTLGLGVWVARESGSRVVFKRPAGGDGARALATRARARTTRGR
ncbi:hypothetical protein GW17_00034740 [Ensete ventricosum]|nr:hypothetical protein GW17_00034740 [Ensete ventricosum]RZR94081.1 hypothetical protein BHM03_00022701 [Ensete ventricosum]